MMENRCADWIAQHRGQQPVVLLGHWLVGQQPEHPGQPLDRLLPERAQDGARRGADGCGDQVWRPAIWIVCQGESEQMDLW